MQINNRLSARNINKSEKEFNVIDSGGLMGIYIVSCDMYADLGSNPYSVSTIIPKISGKWSEANEKCPRPGFFTSTLQIGLSSCPVSLVIHIPRAAFQLSTPPRGKLQTGCKMAVLFGGFFVIIWMTYR